MPIILIIGGIVIALGVGALMYTNSNSTEPTVQPETVDIRVEDIEETVIITDEPAEQPDVTPTNTGYSDGTYQATAPYLTPARTEHSVDVTLTIVDGVVTETDIAFDGKTPGETSNDNQARFADAYTALVVGQPLDSVSLSRVGGASLTSTAFNEAVAEIKADARG